MDVDVDEMSGRREIFIDNLVHELLIYLQWAVLQVHFFLAFGDFQLT